MGFGDSKLSSQLNLLKEFKKYEIFIYICFFDSSYENKDIDFYFVPKEYIINFCSCFNYSKHSNDLEQLIIYGINRDSRKWINKGTINKNF